MNKNFLLFLLRVAVSFILIYIVIRGVNVKSIFSEMLVARQGFIFLAFFIFILAQIIGAYKWHHLAHKVFEIFYPAPLFLKYYYIGSFYTFFIPGGQFAGEGMKALRLTQGRPEKAKLLFSQFADRVSGFIGAGIFLLISFSFSPVLRSDPVSWTGFAFSIGITALGVIMFFAPNHSIQFFFFFSKKISSLRSLEAIVVHNIAHIKKKKGALLYAIGIACVSHLASIFATYTVLLSLNIHIPLIYVVWIYLVMGILIFLPISYAGLGLREGTFVYYLTLVGVAKENALGAALIFFGLQISTAFIGGAAELKEIWSKK